MIKSIGFLLFIALSTTGVTGKLTDEERKVKVAAAAFKK